MKNNSFRLSIIIVNWNAKKFLYTCLKSIEKQIKIPHEIIVVDNHSEDGSQKMIKRHFPQVILISNKKNLGFSQANNQAIFKTRGKYILILNPDTKIEGGAVEKSLKFIAENPKIGLLGVRLKAKNGETQLSSGRQLPSIWGEFVGFFLRNPFPKTHLFGSYLMSWWDHRDRRKVEAICGAYMLGRRKTFIKLKGFDEEYFMYGEDADLCARVKKAGLKVFYLGDISITHFGAKSSNYSPQSILRSGVAGTAALYLFFKKNRSLSYAKNYQLMMRFFSFFEYILRRFYLLFLKKDKNLNRLKAKSEVYRRIIYWHIQ